MGIFALALFLLGARAQNILINEIMYHPASQDSREEYLELFNAGPTNVNLTGWQFTKGINFTFPSNTVLSPSSYLVVAAHGPTFASAHPGVANYVAGYLVVRTTNVATGTYINFENSLSNVRDALQLEDAAGNVIDSLTYADEGDWATRRRGFFDGGYQGWTWSTDADGFGKSLELINSSLPNQYGQNWSVSAAFGGTPGTANSIASANAAPIVADVAHTPVIPQPTNAVTISARVIDETAGAVVRLFWRVNNGAPLAFANATMLDNGLSGDGTAGDGIYGASIPAQANGSVVEFYVEAVDVSNKTNSWPRPAVDTDGVTVMNRANFAYNALYQVDSAAYTGSAPLYKIILTPGEMTELGNMLSGSPQSDAAFNTTFISVDAQGTEVRYLGSIRNRGHGSRNGNPHNYRLGFTSDRTWRNREAINMNARTPWAQHFGSVLSLKSGAAGGESYAAQLRINGGAGPGGTPPNNHYAANEDIGADWAENHFPNDSGGNAYKVVRDINPPNFDYRGASPSSYMNTYFKQSNVSENDFGDMITMLEVMGENQTGSFTTERARAVINVEQWMTHLAVMNLLGNNETGLNTGYNDDYYMYRGINDPRFILLYHDLDTIDSQGGSLAAGDPNLFSATLTSGGPGSGNAMNNFMHWPEFEPIYYRSLQRLLDTTFAKTNFDGLMDQTIGFYVPGGTITTMKSWMDTRRGVVQGLLNNYFAVNPQPPTATVSGAPRSPTPFGTATLTVGGSNVVSYRAKLNNGSYGSETAVATPISLAGLANGSSNIVYVIGKSSAGAWLDVSSPTVSTAWIVNTTTPAVRLNEVLAQNVAAVNHVGTFPDVIELFNEGGSPVNIGGLRLTDDPANPNKFTFPTNTMIASGSYLLVYANTDDGTGGLHAGFSLSASGEGVYLFHATSNTVLDSVVFGLQLNDLSIGRFGSSGEWKLSTPTFPGANTAKPTGDQRLLRINEWLTSGTPPFAEDFVELYNSSSLPIDFGNCYFTDEPIGAPTLHRVPPLTFIQSNSWLALIADGNTGAGADHIGFGLSSDLGEIVLFDPLLSPIDCVSYGPQRPNVSEGRCSDGGGRLTFLSAPTPGTANFCPVPPAGVVTVLPYSTTWRYNFTANLDGTTWKTTNFNDGSWLTGQGAFGTIANLAEPVRTQIFPQTTTRTTAYFRVNFALPSSGSIASLLLYHYTDDGMVVHLNGQEAYRFNLPLGPISYTNRAVNVQGVPPELGPISLPLTNVFAGTNLIAVETHQGDPTSTDMYSGVRLDLITNSASAAGVRINEILANNSNVEEPDGSTPDWVEFYNPSAAPVDLGGASLTDTLTLLQRWIFPGGSLVPAGGYRRVFLSPNDPVSATNTGFGLKDTGDSLYLISSGGALLDNVTFGLQAVDFSIGR
ncbi:MAG TPA: lamin tail domain-containing protein, partial [Verrucomicrobiae bacterium]